MTDIITAPWPWYVAGPLIALVMFALIIGGKTFGISSNLRTICSACGAGKISSFFNFDWKAQTWNLIFLLGVLIGGFIAKNFMSDTDSVILAQNTVNQLTGFSNPAAAARARPACQR